MGYWLETRYGKQIDPADVRVEQIDILDIAHSLSLQCRFNGHCSLPYSVAEHSVRCAAYLYEKWLDRHLALQGLLHDATEYLVGDLPRPLKLQLPEYKKIEEQVAEKIAQKFHLPQQLDQRVKEADNILLATEARDLIGEHTLLTWNLPETPLPKKISPVEWRLAQVSFLNCFAALHLDDRDKVARQMATPFGSIGNFADGTHD